MTEKLKLTDRSLVALQALIVGKAWDCRPNMPYVGFARINARQAFNLGYAAACPPYGQTDGVSIDSYNTKLSTLTGLDNETLEAVLPQEGEWAKRWPVKGSTHWNYEQLKVRWMFEPCTANGSELGRPNVLGVAQNYMSPHIGVFTFGCRHTMQATTVSNCYHKHTCEHCGYTYYIDSGD